MVPPTNSTAYSGRKAVKRECGLDVVPQALETFKFRDVLGACCPRFAVLDRYVNFDEAFG